MSRLAPSKGWARVLAILGGALILHAASPTRAEIWRGPAAQEGMNLPRRPSGTDHLRRIGPQALVSEDEHGRVRMVDEPSARPSRRDVAVGMTTALGVFGVSGFLMLEGQPGLTLDVGGANVGGAVR
jgi:hypothetical protein